MFQNASAFNQPLNAWNVANVEDMHAMFYGASAFNQPLDAWDVANVERMYGMFYDALAFNQPLNAWIVANVREWTVANVNISAGALFAWLVWGVILGTPLLVHAAKRATGGHNDENTVSGTAQLPYRYRFSSSPSALRAAVIGVMLMGLTDGYDGFVCDCSCHPGCGKGTTLAPDCRGHNGCSGTCCNKPTTPYPPGVRNVVESNVPGVGSWGGGGSLYVPQWCDLRGR